MNSKQHGHGDDCPKCKGTLKKEGMFPNNETWIECNSCGYIP